MSPHEVIRSLPRIAPRSVALCPGALPVAVEPRAG